MTGWLALQKLVQDVIGIEACKSFEDAVRLGQSFAVQATLLKEYLQD
jgi:hypothetical protein